MIKGTLLAILIVALSGYMFNAICIRTKYRIPKFQGSHLLYRSLFAGLIIFLFATVLFGLLWPFTSQSSFLYEFALRSFPELTQSEFNLYSILGLSLCIALISAKIFNTVLFKLFSFLYFYKAEKIKKEAVESSDLIKESDQPRSTKTKTKTKTKINGRKLRKRLKRYTDFLFDVIVYKSSTDNGFISHVLDACLTPRILLITLASRRCYVCYPYGVKTPKDHIEAQELGIIPLYSGYRHQDDICLEITTPYSDMVDLLEKQGSKFNDEELRAGIKIIDDYQITIPYNQVLSISSFDPNKYKSFKEIENARRNDIRSAREEKEKGTEIVVNPHPDT